MSQDLSSKVSKVTTMVYEALSQPKQTGNSLRKQYWVKTWAHIKEFSPQELTEIKEQIHNNIETLQKLVEKIDSLQNKKTKQVKQEPEEEFLDSSSVDKQPTGHNWSIRRPLEKPKTDAQMCQAIWTVITNRAIYIVDQGKKVKPSLSRDILIEKNRLLALPALLDNKTIKDILTGKPLMNLYPVTQQIKEHLLWLLAEKAKLDINFRKLYKKFLKEELVDKKNFYSWAKSFEQQASDILHSLD